MNVLRIIWINRYIQHIFVAKQFSIIVFRVGIRCLINPSPLISIRFYQT